MKRRFSSEGVARDFIPWATVGGRVKETFWGEEKRVSREDIWDCWHWAEVGF